MKSFWKSPAWAWLPLLPALLFAAWGFWLVRHVRQEPPPADVGERYLLPLALAGFVLSLLLCLVLYHNQLDLRELRRVEAALRAGEERFRTFMDNSPAVAFIKDAQGRYVYGNRAWAERFGKPPEDILGKTDADLWPDKTARIFRDSDRLVLTGTGGVQAIEAGQLPNGEACWLKVLKFPMRDPRGQILVGGIVVDVTEQKRFQESLAASEARLQRLIDLMPVGCILNGPDFRFTYWNPAAERIFGFRFAAVRGQHPFDTITPPASQPRVQAIFERLAAGAEAVSGPGENVTADGRVIVCEWSDTPLVDADGTFAGILSMCQDVSERVRLEERLRQAEKLEAIGQLAGGVAHDFNNMLSVILGCSDMALRAVPPRSEAHELLQQVHEAGERAAHLTRQLLLFSRKHQVRPVVFDLNAAVAELERILRRLISADIKLVTQISTTPGHVRADRGQVELALVNLVVNARDAMPAGGTLEIAVAEVALDAARVEGRPGRAPGRYVELTVRDTGHGMDEATRARIFEPFFTTKEVGKGTGLGLATVYGIVEKSDGFIEVDSQVGRGTAFRVYLPAIAAALAEAPAAPAPAPWPRGDETVLVVEDEAEVRLLARRILEMSGYTVLEAGNGREALELARRRTAPVPLLLTDVVMPEMGGPELAEELLRVWPGLKVLFMSGYTDGPLGQRLPGNPPAHLLQKPFGPAQLAGAVRALLDQTAPVAPVV